MAIDIIMPKLGLTMSEGTIIKWHKSEGDYIEKGDVIFELETDKSINEETAKQSGYLLKTYYAEGDVAPILTRVAVMGEKDEIIEDQLPEEELFDFKEEKEEEKVIAAPPVQKNDNNGETRVIASPLARKIANQMGINISDVVATNNKRIVADDVRSFSDTQLSTPLEMQNLQAAPMSGMRKTIAKRMHGSLQENAQTTSKVVVDMTEATRWRNQFRGKNIPISYNDIIAYTVCKALMEYPAINSELVGESIITKPFVNLGIAVALEEGLIVPVLNNANSMKLTELSSAIKEKSDAAREGKLSSDEFNGGSFTISNLGMYGLDEFVAIINPPEAGILAVGAVREAPAVVDGSLCVRSLMTLTLSYDHRIVDGAPAAQFLMRVKELLEQPYLLL